MTKRLPRADKYKGIIYDDWYEQQIQELIDGNVDSDDADAGLSGDIFDIHGTIGDENE